MRNSVQRPILPLYTAIQNGAYPIINFINKKHHREKGLCTTTVPCQSSGSHIFFALHHYATGVNLIPYSRKLSWGKIFANQSK